MLGKAMSRAMAPQPLNQPIEMVDRNQVLGTKDEFAPAFGPWSGGSG
jgi:hypothetical protein